LLSQSHRARDAAWPFRRVHSRGPLVGDGKERHRRSVQHLLSPACVTRRRIGRACRGEGSDITPKATDDAPFPLNAPCSALGAGRVAISSLLASLVSFLSSLFFPRRSYILNQFYGWLLRCARPRVRMQALCGIDAFSRHARVSVFLCPPSLSHLHHFVLLNLYRQHGPL